MTPLKVRATAHAADLVRAVLRLLCGLTGHRRRQSPVGAVTWCGYCGREWVDVREPEP